MKKCFGSSEEFIKSIDISNYRRHNLSKKDLQLLASCSYDDDNEWGEKVSNFR